MTDKPLRLALFDCDGTLVDSVFAIQRAMVQVFEKFSYKEPDLDETKLVIGLSLDRAIARLLDRPVDDEILEMVMFFWASSPASRGLELTKYSKPTSFIALLQSKQQTNARQSLIRQWL